jgi:hypothetical protein
MRTLLGQSVPNIITNSDFPKGTPKDDSPLGSKTGTPITEKAGIADCYNAILAVIAEAGLTPNEQAEKQVGGSQFSDALEQLFSKNKTAEFFYVWIADQAEVISPPQIGTAHYSSGIVTLIFHGVGTFTTPNTPNEVAIGIAFSDDVGVPIAMEFLPLFMQLSDSLAGISTSTVFAKDALSVVLISCAGYSGIKFDFYMLESINENMLPYNVNPNSSCGNNNSFSISYLSKLQQ